MSEYIEREALREELRHCCIVAFDEKSGEPYVIDIPQLLRRTTVPDEVVVHCRDCKYKTQSKVNKNGFLICPASGMEINDDDYCSYGERRESEAGR